MSILSFDRKCYYSFDLQLTQKSFQELELIVSWFIWSSLIWSAITSSLRKAVYWLWLYEKIQSKSPIFKARELFSLSNILCSLCRLISLSLSLSLSIFLLLPISICLEFTFNRASSLINYLRHKKGVMHWEHQHWTLSKTIGTFYKGRPPFSPVSGI